MLVFLAVLSLASATTLHENIVPSSVHRVGRHHTPIGLVQLLKSPVQTIISPRDTVQYIEQPQYGLEPNRQQYSIISLEPDNQYSIGSILPQQQLVYVQPQAEHLTLEAIRPIEVEKRITLQPAISRAKQLVTVVESDLRKSPIDNLRITSEAHPLQYSNVLQPVHQTSPVSVHSRPSAEDAAKVGQYSYFLRGSDLENKEVVGQEILPQVSVLKQHLEPSQYSSVSLLKQHLEPPQYSSVSVLKQHLEPPQYSSVSVFQPRIRAVVHQPLKQVSIQEVIRPQEQVGVVGYSNVGSGSRILSQIK